MTESNSEKKSRVAGKLRIGDHWNAINIIALSQNNPLKAIAEFVENSIDARAQKITIVRGKERGEHYLRIQDDGEGIRRDDRGIPDFQYVATHICDSIKRHLKIDGATGLQGEFGIGLLSFWTVGEHLILTSAGADGKAYQMHMTKGEPNYRVSQKRVLFAEKGTELKIGKILPGIRQFSGEKIQWYLASELRNRIRNSGVEIRVVDRTARAEYKVEPRKFDGRLLPEVSNIAGPSKEIYLELYLTRHDASNGVSLYRAGTRVLANLSELPLFQKLPWTSGYLQGIVDAPYVHLTPGTRSGVIHDDSLARLAEDLASVETAVHRIIEQQIEAEEDQASRDVLKSIQKALKEALLSLPPEEYDWFDLRSRESPGPKQPPNVDDADDPLIIRDAAKTLGEQPAAQKQFFEYAGPLFKVRISPASAVVAIGSARNFRAVPRDRSGHLVEQDLLYQWTVVEGRARLENDQAEICSFHAGKEPGLVRLNLTATQGEITTKAQALVTVTDSLIVSPRADAAGGRGIPSYTFQKAPGELWRSRFDSDRSVIIINSGHRDFVFASRNRLLKLRYVFRLFAKELVLTNFPGTPADQLLERLIELSLYAEENLK
jgi:hypothetical protein